MGVRNLLHDLLVRLGLITIEEKPEGHVPAVVLPGISPTGEHCNCEVPQIGIKGLQQEDEEFIKNLDPYTFKGLRDKKPDGDKAFAAGFDTVMAEKNNLDKVLAKLKSAYTDVATKKRELEQAQQRLAWEHFSKCRFFKTHYGMFMPCEETFREAMEAYRDAHQDPSCIVGASLPLKPASMLPLAAFGRIPECVAIAAARQTHQTQENPKDTLAAGYSFL
mmetsp:Transcript_1797/g.3098  ORF Transcript_1797/g.3098 Transcript_1797/m.3098 type:complete len:220 (-) Transcript_1797:24-683(-)